MPAELAAYWSEARSLRSWAGYVLGNLLTSVVAGIGTSAWMLTFGVLYPVLPAIVAAAALRLLLHEVTFRRLDST
jgi:predicted PurR-regulated permease PerM